MSIQQMVKLERKGEKGHLSIWGSTLNMAQWEHGYPGSGKVEWPQVVGVSLFTQFAILVANGVIQSKGRKRWDISAQNWGRKKTGKSLLPLPFALFRLWVDKDDAQSTGKGNLPYWVHQFNTNLILKDPYRHIQKQYLIWAPCDESICHIKLTSCVHVC